MTAKLRALLGAVLVVVPLDQASKLWVGARIHYADRIPLVDGFLYLTHVRNPGAAFGVLADAHPAARTAFFVGISLVAVGVIVSFFRRLAPGDRLSALALGLVLGGALGNLIDRLLRGEVVDFLHVRLWGGRAWPDFNLADASIVVGVGLLVLELVASEGETRAQGTPSVGGTTSPSGTPRTQRDGDDRGDSPSTERG
jgi:signal peptidase II